MSRENVAVWGALRELIKSTIPNDIIANPSSTQLTVTQFLNLGIFIDESEIYYDVDRLRQPLSAGLSGLLNDIPAHFHQNADWSQSGRRLGKALERAYDRMRLLPTSLSSKDNEELSRIEAVLYSNDGLPTKILTQYQIARDQYYMAERAYAALASSYRLEEVHDQDRKRGLSELKRNRDFLLKKWRIDGRKDFVEGLIGRISALRRQDFGRVLNNARGALEICRRTSLDGGEYFETKLGGNLEQGETWTKRYVNTFWLRSMNSEKLRELEISGVDRPIWEFHTRSGLEITPALTGANLGTSDLEIEFETKTVPILRDWLYEEVFDSPGWYFEDQRLLSSGQIGQSADVPLFIQSMVLVRNLRLRATSRSPELEGLGSIMSKLPSMSFGGLRLKGSKLEGADELSFDRNRPDDVPGSTIKQLIDSIGLSSIIDRRAPSRRSTPTFVNPTDFSGATITPIGFRSSETMQLRDLQDQYDFGQHQGLTFGSEDDFEEYYRQRPLLRMPQFPSPPLEVPDIGDWNFARSVVSSEEAFAPDPQIVAFVCVIPPRSPKSRVGTAWV